MIQWQWIFFSESIQLLSPDRRYSVASQIWQLSVFTLVCVLTLILGSQQAWANCMAALQGKQYTELPADLCQGYTDNLLGKHASQEYAGVVCDRPEGSYFFLQRLVDYTTERKAIWKIVRIKPLSKLHTNELAVSAGCSNSPNSANPIFAIVKAQNNAPYQTLLAWQVNFAEEIFVEIDPKQVSCHPSLTPSRQ